MLTLPHQPPPTAAVLTRALRASRGLSERQRLGAALIEVLNGCYGLPACDFKVADRHQVHSTDPAGKLSQATYGYYRCRLPRSGPPRLCGIRIYNRTAVRGQVVSPGAFTNTLLHEWLHHFDFTALRLRRSPHTSGFFQRLRSLRAYVDPECPPEEGRDEPRVGAVASEARIPKEDP